MSKLYNTNGYPVLVNDIVYDYLIKHKLKLLPKTIDYSVAVYNPDSQHTQSLAAFIFKNKYGVSKRRLNTQLKNFDTIDKYYDYTITNMADGAEFHDRITDNDKKIRPSNKVEVIDNKSDIQKEFYDMGEYERFLVLEVCENTFNVAKNLEIDSSKIHDFVQLLMDEKRTKYFNKQKIMKLKSDIIDKEKEIEIIQSGYYK